MQIYFNRFGNNPFPQQQTDIFGQPMNSQFGNSQFNQYSSTSNNQFDPFDMIDNPQSSINYNPYQMQQSQITNPYQQMQTSTIGSNNPFSQQKTGFGSTTSYGTNEISPFNMSSSNFSSPNLATSSTYDSFSSSSKQVC
jgi:hypothetical protein